MKTSFFCLITILVLSVATACNTNTIEVPMSSDSLVVDSCYIPAELDSLEVDSITVSQ